jgi:hypothetical protein
MAHPAAARPEVPSSRKEDLGARGHGKEETGMKTINGRRIHALFRVWIVQS